MRGYVASLVLAGVLALSGASSAAAQGFDSTTTDAGVVIGLGGLGDASFSFGGRFEKAIKDLPDLGGGVLGVEGSVDYYHYNYNFLGADYGGITVLPISVTGNYHFKLQNRKVDPFLGLGLGYEHVSWSCGVYDCSGAGSSGIYFVGRAGLRYYLNDKAALYFDAGAGAATVDVGVVVKLN